jgi:DNA-binding transcriptional LysR family regulator
VDLLVIEAVAPDMIGAMAIDCEPLDTGRVCVVARAGHPESRAHNLHDLHSKPWVFAPQPLPLRSLMDEEFARNGLPIPSNRIEVNSIARTIEYILDTDAIAVLPLWAVADLLASKRLVRIPVILAGSLRRTALLRRRGESLASGPAALLAALRAIARDGKESVDVSAIRERAVCT